MQLSPYLFFDGQCEAAFKFYEQCLGGQIVAMMTYGETPMAGQTSPEEQKNIVHARLVVGDAVLMGGDAPPVRYEKPQGFAVAFNTATPSEAERIFQTLAENGSITMPIQETFWAVRFGMCVDRFGILWMVSCESAA